MAFLLTNLALVSVGVNSPQITTTNYPDTSDNVLVNSFNLYSYQSSGDAIATIAASGYFNSLATTLAVNDCIMCLGSDANEFLQVTSITAGVVATTAFTPAGTVNTANIVDGAVTYAKIQDTAAGSVLIGNPTGGAADVSEITLGNGLDFASTALEVKPSLASQAIVPMTLAQWLGMYATPYLLVAAPASGYMNIVESVYIDYDYGSAALANGGAVSVQYGSTDHAGGTLVTNAEAATDFTGASAETMYRLQGTLSTGTLKSAGVAAALYISNDTAPFITGTGGTFNVIVNYRTVLTI